MNSNQHKKTLDAALRGAKKLSEQRFGAIIVTLSDDDKGVVVQTDFGEWPVPSYDDGFALRDLLKGLEELADLK